MKNEKQLLDERARVRAEQVSITDTVEAENREITAEETQKWETLDARLDELTKQIEVARKDAKRSAEFDDRSGDTDTPEHRDVPQNANERYIEVFRSYLVDGVQGLDNEQRQILRSGFVGETRAQGVGTDAAGGYLVPPGFRSQMIEAMLDFGSVERVAQVIDTETGNAVEWPTNDDTANVGALLAENTQVSEQDLTIGTDTLDAYKYTSKLVRVSLELLQDSAFDLEGFLSRKLAERIARITNQHFTTGTGTSQPDGIVTSATSGVTAASTTAVTGDELISLVHSVDPAYRRSNRVRFMMSDAALASIRKLKDSNNAYLWQPSIQAGVPDSLLGYPVEINQDMADPAAGVKSVLFGDFFAGYVVRRVRGVQMLRLAERYADYFQVGFVSFARYDGTAQDTSAYKALTQAAA